MGLLKSVFGTPQVARQAQAEFEPEREQVVTVRFPSAPILQTQLAKVEEELLAFYLKGLVTNEDAIDQVKSEGVGFYQTMLRTDSHLASLDRKLRSKAANMEFQILPGDPKDQTSKDIADFVTDALYAFDFVQALTGVAHAVSKGFSVSEVMYNTGFKWRGRKMVGIERIGRIKEKQFTIKLNREVRLTTISDPLEGVSIPRNSGKFIVMFYGDGPWGDGLLNYAYPSWYLKRNSLIAFSRFQERWGNPPLTAEYSGQNSDVVLDMLEKLYGEAIAALPAGTNLQVLQPQRDYDFIPGLNYFDDQMSRLYTGGDLSTGHAGGKGNMGATEQHAQTEDELVASISKSVFLVMNQQLIRPLVDLNFGKQIKYPYASLGIPEVDTPDQYMNRVGTVFEKKVMVPISKSQFYEQTGFAPPKDDNDILMPSEAPAVPTFGFSERGQPSFIVGSATPSNSLIPPAQTRTVNSTTRYPASVETRLSELQRSMRKMPVS